MSRINSEIRALFINGPKVPIVDGTFTWSRGAKTREAVMGSGQVLGFSEANAAGSCSFDVAYVEKSDPTEFDNLTNAQIRIVWDVGAEWMMKRASSTEGSSGSAGAGTYTLNFSGDSWIITKK